MNQLNINFDQPHQLARKRDPITSKQAAEKIQPALNDHYSEILQLLRERPGKTGSEIDAHFQYMRREASKRLSTVQKKGLIKKGPTVVCRITGNNAFSWFPAHYTDQQCREIASRRTHL